MCLLCWHQPTVAVSVSVNTSVNSPRNVRGQVEVAKTSSRSDDRRTHLRDLQNGVAFTNFPLTYFIIAANRMSPPVCYMLCYTLGAQLFLEPPHATPT